MLTAIDVRGAGERRLESDGAVETEQFAELLRVHAQVAYRLALTMLHEPGLAEDAVQEAALRAWKRRSALRDPGAFRQWFLAIVANQCRSVRRGVWWGLGAASGVLPEGGVPSHETTSDQHVDLERSLRSLGAEDRLAVFLYYYLDMPVPVAAEAMDCSESAFRSRLARAVRRLRPGLELEEFAGG